MKYGKPDAKDYARRHLRGLWAATMTPFTPSTLAFDEDGFRRNLRHWIDDLGIAGFFVAGKQGEFFSMSVPERKRCFEIAVEEAGTKAGTMLSCSDQNLDVVLDLARHAQRIGADYIVVHSPVLNFVHPQDDTLRAYYRHLSDSLDIGIALWSHPDAGYLMSPELVAELAELPNVVAIKYSVPREMYARLTRMAGDRIIVSTASEDEWFDNMVELDWQVYLCSTPPFLMQTRGDRRMHDYTALVRAGDVAGARALRDSLDPVRAALKSSRPPGKPHAHQKYWQELLGQVGGPTRRPMLNLTAEEKAATRAAFEACGLARIRSAA